MPILRWVLCILLLSSAANAAGKALQSVLMIEAIKHRARTEAPAQLPADARLDMIPAMPLPIPEFRTTLSDADAADSKFKGLFGIGAVWSFVAIFDFDDRRVSPAVIDIGITHGGTRTPGHACEINYAIGTATDVVCSSELGPYNGVMQQLNPSIAGAYTTHGTRMKNHIAATINDGGPVGIAGQVAVPNLYQMQDVHGFLFELKTAIQRAVDDGASVINISAGFPCNLLWNTQFSPDICTATGRAWYCANPFQHAIWPDLTNPVDLTANAYTNFVLALTPFLQARICEAGVAALALEGDIRQSISSATLYAQQRGVPVVVSAGNLWGGAITLNAATGESLNLTPESQVDVSDWGILPATTREPIVAGGVDQGASGYPNSDFHGDRVDVWGPGNDTSPAAAITSGTIAVAQAVNPRLNPRTPGLQYHEITQVPERIRTLLRETAYTSAHPDLSDDPYRRNMINPYRFVREAARGLVPEFEALGYPSATDDLLAPNLNDARTISVSLSQPQLRSGSVVFVPGPEPFANWDRYILEYPSAGGEYDTTIELRFLRDYGDLALTAEDADALTLVNTFDSGSVERVRRYTLSGQQPQSAVTLTVRGVALSDDNLYRLKVEATNPNTLSTDSIELQRVLP